LAINVCGQPNRPHVKWIDPNQVAHRYDSEVIFIRLDIVLNF
jgi:hypothetical protein